MLPKKESLAGWPLFIGPIILAFVIVALDQWSKVEALAYFNTQQGAVAITDFFNLVLVLNEGISFGLLDRGPAMQGVFALIALGVVTFLILYLPYLKHRLSAVAFGLLIGGAIGNVIDRLRLGAVVDFLDFHAFGHHWPAFNVADSAVVAAVMLLLLQSLVFDKKNRHS